MKIEFPQGIQGRRTSGLLARARGRISRPPGALGHGEYPNLDRPPHGGFWPDWEIVRTGKKKAGY